MNTFLQDLRFAARILAKKPAFTLTVVLTLALGIGSSTAIFSVVEPILFEPLPYPQAARIMTIWDHGPTGSQLETTFGTYRELVQRSLSFETIAVHKAWQPTLTGGTEPERLAGQRISASYLRVLGVTPAIGRDFESADDQPDGPNVVILSDSLWRRRFGGDPQIRGQQITLNENHYSIIGVMPRGFENVLSSAAEIWSPLQYDMSQGTAWGHHLRMVGRLHAGIKTDQAGKELDEIAHHPESDFPRPPWASLKNGLIVTSLQNEITAGVKPALLAVLAGVLLMLLIACVNVANLLLALSAQRRGEFAMRAALGAGRMRVIRQLLTESLLLSIIGGVLGMIVAVFGVRALVALSMSSIPRASAIGVNGVVFGFAVCITTLIGVLVGLIPAINASRSNLLAGAQQTSGRTAGRYQLTRRTLVVAEIAFALVLLVSAGLLLRSMRVLFAIDPGFNASNLLTMQVQTSGHRFDKDTTDRFFAQALERVRALPGVEAAAFTSQLPLSIDDDEYGASFEGDDPNTANNVFRYAVSPGYFETTGIPLRRGRLLDAHDVAGAPRAVLISESLAEHKFQDRDPIGQRLHIGPRNEPWYTIVGVVGNIKQTSLAANQPDAVYITTSQSSFVEAALSLLIRTRGDTGALTPAVKSAIWSVDKDQPITRIATMDQLLVTTAAERRFALILFDVFGIVALVMAATGIYGVLTASVNERIREIGVRLALGAQRSDVLALVLRQGVTLIVSGLGIGLLGAWAATRLLRRLLFGISANDPLTFAMVALLLMLVALIAGYIPARRATKVDPLVALRSE